MYSQRSSVCVNSNKPYIIIADHSGIESRNQDSCHQLVANMLVATSSWLYQLVATRKPKTTLVATSWLQPGLVATSW